MPRDTYRELVELAVYRQLVHLIESHGPVTLESEATESGPLYSVTTSTGEDGSYDLESLIDLMIQDACGAHVESCNWESFCNGEDLGPCPAAYCHRTERS